MNLKKITKKTAYDAYKASRAAGFELMNKNYCEKGATILAGDSITEGFSFMELFAEYMALTSTPVYNRGISGDTSDRLLERLEKTVLCIKPKNLVLLIGTNDLGVGADPAFTVSNVEKIVEQSKKRCKDINIIIEGVYPINPTVNKQGKRNNKAIAEINRGLAELAKKHKVQFLDLTNSLSDESGLLKREFTYDGLHATAAAYEVIAKAVIPLLK